MKYLTIPVTSYQQNCSLIWCEETGDAALIDPGGDEQTLINEVSNNKLNLVKVLLTHGHLDHVGGAVNIANHYKVPIIGPHQDDEFWLEWIPGQAEMFGFPPAESFTPDQWLKEGDQVTVGNVSLDVIHCPGHTPGHVVLFEAESKTLFAGDILFKGSIGRTDFPRGNHGDLISAIKNKLFPLGDDVIVVPGHGPNTTIGAERVSNPFL